MLLLHYCTSKASSPADLGLKVELRVELGMQEELGPEAELVWGQRGNEGKDGLGEGQRTK